MGLNEHNVAVTVFIIDKYI